MLIPFEKVPNAVHKSTYLVNQKSLVAVAPTFKLQEAGQRKFKIKRLEFFLTLFYDILIIKAAHSDFIYC